MAMTPYSGDTSIIGKLGTTPQERGLTTQQFKDKFDEGLKTFVEWFNDVHKTEFDAHLADIESGTFTPIVVATVEPTTYRVQKGYYEKIGKQVTVYITVAVTTKAAGMSGPVIIGGLPFVPAFDVERFPSCSVGEVAYSSYGAGKQLLAVIYPNLNAIRLLIASDTEVNSVTADAISDGFYIILQCTYKTN